MMNGPWFIYDHYLTVKEWCPNFHPQSDTISKVAVWVRISGLPIEYYDARVLTAIGNTIGRTIKVDKNTLMQERGKYARLCVEVDLTTSLLAMFTLKERKYNVEYEGLHLLCTNCGKFGHYKEGCPEKVREGEKVTGGEQAGNGAVAGKLGLAGSGSDGPWVVVQKQKRSRKTLAAEGGNKRSSGKTNNTPHLQGSHFDSLREETLEIEDESINLGGGKRQPGVEEQVECGTNGRDKNQEGVQKGLIINNENNVKGLKNASGVSMTQPTGSVASQERIGKNSRLSTRGTGSFKGKSTGKTHVSTQTKTSIISELLEKKKMEKLFAAQFKKVTINGDKQGNNEKSQESKSATLIENDDVSKEEAGLNLSLHGVNKPNGTRPPDIQTTPLDSSFVSNSNEIDTTPEGDEFLDAHDQGIAGVSDSEMELVGETPDLRQ
ncbi:hypothetical protein A2U01_0006021 [Trifolium medium]|uniref:CCHC-type domain-containing protein n=1 Tax=Trifolium medium TaxID=97028 RepID=A0A392MCC9_9FABA|nr:hypothetical protein [Trifolium medium]